MSLLKESILCYRKLKWLRTIIELSFQKLENEVFKEINTKKLVCYNQE